MALTVSVYKWKGQSWSGGGLTDTVDELTVVNVDGPTPAEIHPDRPAVMLVAGPTTGPPNPILVPAVLVDDGWVPSKPVDMVGGARLLGPMAGGTLAGSDDARWCRAVAELTGGLPMRAVPVHDRFETQAQYDRLST